MAERRPQQTIADLIAAAREGDNRAREKLFERCRDYISVIARTKVEGWMRTRFDGSDLVQQTLLEAYQAFDQFEGTTEEEWLVWLKRILNHNTQDAIRHHRAGKRAAQREVRPPATSAESELRPLDPPASLPTPSRVMMRHEEDLALTAAIGQLSPDHQEVVHLRGLQRLSFEEVAERMGRSRPAVQMLWARALKRLDELLSADA
ncbi:MAG: sigma-70 family RNA polymerase sigma factor [Planctomycetaceae bacterium]|nr:sigma-70 family RNA polymerase sigma factor [Planctomycetaceae bacterium]